MPYNPKTEPYNIQSEGPYENHRVHPKNPNIHLTMPNVATVGGFRAGARVGKGRKAPFGLQLSLRGIRFALQAGLWGTLLKP